MTFLLIDKYLADIYFNCFTNICKNIENSMYETLTSNRVQYDDR